METIDMLTLRQTIIEISRSLHTHDNTEHTIAWKRLRGYDENILHNTLLAMLKDSDTESSCSAALLLVSLNKSTGIKEITPFLHSTDSALRWTICGLLSRYGSQQDVNSLIDVLENDPEADVRMLAAFGLGKIGDSGAIPTLEKVLQNDLGVDYEGRTVKDATHSAIQEIRLRERQM